MRTAFTGVVLLAMVAASGVGAAQECAASPHLDYVCGPANAEDLVLVPGTDWVLASSMAPGDGIYLVEASTRTWTPIYRGGAGQVRHDPVRYPACAVPPVPTDLISHGLHLRVEDDGPMTLYVVGHGGREAIEVFDVVVGPGRPDLAWVGCVLMPDGLAANSVTSARDGTLLATVLMHPGQSFTDVFSGRPTGAIYRWTPGDETFQPIPGSELPGNNGIELSPDEHEIYVVSTGLQTISVFANASPTRLLRSTPPLDFGPDNIHLTADGELITAGPSGVDHDCGELDPENVSLEEFAACPRGSVAATFDPRSLRETARWSSPPDARFSNATMAVEVGDEVWIGTFSGSRIAVVPNAR